MESYPDDKSNWPDLPTKLPKQRQQEFLALDVDGTTIMTAPLTCNKSVMEAARSYQKQGRVVEIRYVKLEEQDFQDFTDNRKKAFWQDHLYKPTPCRIMHHR